MIFRCLSLVLIALVSLPVVAADVPVSAADVLASARTHYPLILRAADQIAAAKAAEKEAIGAFDATIESQMSARPSGFYDGKQADARIVKPMPFASSRIYGGYRVSDGNFPIYEDKRITTGGGEYLIGGGLSLLRDRMIDARRLNVANRAAEREIAEIDQTLTRLSVQRDALVQFWRWVAARQMRDVRRDLLAIAEKRQGGVARSVRSGNTASIFLTENQQYILQRQTELNEVERNLNIRAAALSLFLRDENGNPRMLTQATPDILFPEPETSLTAEDALRMLHARPEFARIQQAMQMEKNNREMGENMLLPRADLGVEFSDDQGSGDVTREQAESMIKLDISIPLQRNLGEGRRDNAQAALRALKHEQRLTEDTLKMEITNALKNLEIYKEFIRLTKDEIQLAQTMERAERKRFENGASDFFVLNAREQKVAEARIRYILAQESYHSEIANLNALTMNEKALALDVKN